jgi:hypothetical protein
MSARRVPLFCGGRDYAGRDVIYADLRQLKREGVKLIVAGGQTGADTIAEFEAKQMGIHCAVVDALWDVFGKNAGWRRNEAMELLLPTEVWAYPTGGPGTRGMMRSARRAGIAVYNRTGIA